ncbi:MAG: peptide chain release factor 2, peptide chain release factor 2 [Candidatus Parcubacteria bacterium]|jgi:peptide chain release factor 2
MNKQEIQNKIKQLEQEMLSPDFWNDPKAAQLKYKELEELKILFEGGSKYDNGNAIINIFAGVGGDDAEDWVAMLLDMYMKFVQKKNWSIHLLDDTQNSNGGYRSVTCEVQGKGAYKILRLESGVHRLVRISPFNANGKRQTSFAMVEVMPVIKVEDFVVPESELEVEFTKAGGPGGQNVNKRETAVRITHKESGVSVCASVERTQHANKMKALEIIQGKLFKLKQEQEKTHSDSFAISKVQEIAWGNQIRSYTLNPYKLVKDHRSNFETSQVDKVLAGDIDDLIQSVQQLD